MFGKNDIKVIALSSEAWIGEWTQPRAIYILAVVTLREVTRLISKIYNDMIYGENYIKVIPMSLRKFLWPSDLYGRTVVRF